MSSPRPKSPRPVTPQKKKDESFLEYLGTLGRRKKIKEGIRFFKCVFLTVSRARNEFTSVATLYGNVTDLCTSVSFFLI